LTISPNELILKKCAHWISLRGAEESTNKTGETVYLPTVQNLDTNNLTKIFAKLSRKEVLTYKRP
jgi:hypothetical protein